jgi:PKD repeat protein
MMSGTITLPTGTTTTITVPTPVASLVEYSPVASFSATSTGTSVTLSDLTVDINSGTSIGDSYTYVWDFGDGATTTSTSTTVGVPSVTHTYPIDGTYTVKLTVVDAFGASSVYTSTITVSTPTVTPVPAVVPGGNGPIVGAFGMFIPPTSNPLDDKQVIVRKDGEGAEILAKKTQYRFENDLYFGLKGDEVSRLQDILREKGFFIASSTGYFGAITRNAVIEYQRTNKINTTGYVGPKTRASLNGDKFEVGSYIQTPKASTSTTKTTNKEIISTSSIGNRTNDSVEEKSGLRDRVDNFVKKILNIFGR